MEIVQIAVVVVILIALVKPLGTYVYHVFSNEANWTDKVFGPFERLLYKLIGLKNRDGMSWKKVCLQLYCDQRGSDGGRLLAAAASRAASV